jgi:hypothetical protein
MFPTDANPKDPVKNARNQLLEYFNMLLAVDATAILYKWDKDNDLAADACLKPMALPTTLTGIQSYADQFRPNAEGGDCWCNLQVGFNKDPDEFMAELRAQASVQNGLQRSRPSKLLTRRSSGGYSISLKQPMWIFGRHK